MTTILSWDLGLSVGYAIIKAGVPPVAGSFRIPFRAYQLGEIAVHFEQMASEIMVRSKPDVIVRATRFVGHKVNPTQIGPLFGLSMKLDEMALRRRLRCFEVYEAEARDAFLSKVPRGTKAIKRAVMDACAERGWPVKDDHSCDAIVVGIHTLSMLSPNTAHESTPLFVPRTVP